MMFADITCSPLLDPLLHEKDLDAQVDVHRSVLSELMQKHAPLKSRIFPNLYSSHGTLMNCAG